VSCPARILLLALVLAGCSTAPRRNANQVPDWEDLAAPAAPVKTPPQAAAPPTVSAAQPPAPVAPVAREPLVSPRTETWVPLGRWCRLNGLPVPTRLSTALPGLYELRSASGVLVLRPGSQVAHWDGLEVRLGFAPRLTGGQLYLHGLDLGKTVWPLLAGGTAVGGLPGQVLVIDPGHGGGDAGTRSVLGLGNEKEFTLDWARRLQELLGARGWQVFLTRSNDTELALSNRVAFAAAHKADLFLSLHFNSAGDSRAEAGLETYCLTPTGMPSSLTRGYADEAALVLPNNAFDAQNLQLALRVHRALLAVNGHRDRGVRRARFPGVLRGQQRPAILVEAGYLSNPHEARLIADPAYRQQLAEAVATALGATQEVRSQRAEVGENSPASHSPEGP
jgi:N-acetylmuramoyl-L-alanine amidase